MNDPELIDEARRWLRCLSGALNALLPTPLPLPYVFWRSRPRRPSEDELEVMGLPTLTGCTQFLNLKTKGISWPKQPNIPIS